MLDKQKRVFKFSNGCVAVVTAVGTDMSVHIDNRSFPMMGVTFAARQSMIDTIKRNMGFDNKVKVVYEDYYCAVTVPEKRLYFEIFAQPKSPKYTQISIKYANRVIYNGRQQITFNSIRAIQEFCYSKVCEFISKNATQSNGVSNNRQGFTPMQQTITQVEQKKVQNNRSQPVKRNTSNNRNQSVKVKRNTSNNVQPANNRPHKTIPVMTKFPEDNKKKQNTLYRKVGISDEDAKRGKMSMTNYLLEGLYGLTPEGVKPPTGSMTKLAEEKKGGI